MPRKDGSLTKMEKRDIRDAVGLALTMMGTAVSVASLALTLSPRSDPEGVELARDVKAFLESRGVRGYGLMDLHRAVSDPEAIGHLAEAVGCFAGDPEGRRMVRRLEARRRTLG